MHYLVDGKEYVIHYSELKGKHIEMCQLSDEEFKNKLPDAIHLACIICYFKEIPTDICLSDMGIVHQLTHLLCSISSDSQLKDIRKLFEDQLRLA